MKNFTAIMLMLVSSLAGAQTSVYHPFPDSSAIWTEQAQSSGANNCPGPPIPNPVIVDYNFSYFLSGDTILSGNNYSKIYVTGSAHEHCLFGTAINNWTFTANIYNGALRQDTSLRQVYYIPANDTMECLLYDFNMSVGDSVQGDCLLGGGGCAVVSSIDSFAVGANYRKRINFSNSYSIIEGIGSTSGLLEPLCPFEYLGTLICFAQDGQTLYPDMVTGCEIVSNGSEIRSNKGFIIHPNPMSTFVTVETEPDFKAVQWKIYNMHGVELNSGIVNRNIFDIPRGTLTAGTYLIRVTNDMAQMKTQRIILD